MSTPATQPGQITAGRSGQVLLRMPRTLHAELVDQAEREGVSLNQFIVAALAGATGWRADPEAEAVRGAERPSGGPTTVGAAV